jgi:beta-lactamase class A
MTQSRRAILAGGLGWLTAGPAFAAPQPDWKALETRLGGRLGVWSSTGLAWRAGERFAFCSSFKGVLAGLVLSRVDAGAETLERIVPYGEKDLLSYAPVARAHVAEGKLAVRALCEAAVEVSDNTAANLLLASVGGPPAVTAFARRLGDRVMRLDRNETSLNSNLPGDPRDTTSPRAMAATYGRLVLGDVLKPASRALLEGWMVDCKTGQARLRAKLPAGWRAGDKTGTGERGAAGDVAILWPPKGQPILVACYVSGVTAPDAERDAVFAEIGRMAAERAHG